MPDSYTDQASASVLFSALMVLTVMIPMKMKFKRISFNALRNNSDSRATDLMSSRFHATLNHFQNLDISKLTFVREVITEVITDQTTRRQHAPFNFQEM